MDFITTLAVIGALILLGIWYFKLHYTYWSRRGIPQLNPEFIYGDMRSMIEKNEHVTIKTQEIYNTFKKNGWRYGGFYIFFSRTLIIADIELLKNVYQKDFQHFQANGIFNHEKDLLNQHLLALHGDRWKRMRSSLTPTFSSSKMKNMFDTMTIKAENLKSQSTEIAASGNPFDAKDLMARYATDVIVTTAFGVECDSLKEPNNLFRRYVQDLFQISTWKIFKEEFFPWSILGHLGHKFLGTTELEQFFINMVKETAEAREKSSVTTKDFFYYLLQIKNKDFDPNNPSHGKPRASPDGLTHEQMAAQSFLFYVGGFETTATTMSFALLNLALYPEYQEKCRKEIIEVLAKHDEKLTYEAALEMTYTEQFILESMRFYPPFAHLQRKCTKDYTIPGTSHVIEKGTRVFIPVRGIQMDPDYYPNPEVFNPDNFSKENRQERPDITFLAFGEGPRQCIGMRFGLLNAKIGVATIIKDFFVKLDDKMQLPVVFDPKSFVTTPKGNIWLKLVSHGKESN